MTIHNPPHPGEIVAGILEEQGIGIREFARALKIAPSTAQRLVSGQAVISPEMAIRLAVVLGSTPEMWMRLQTRYSLEKAAQEVDVSGLKILYRPGAVQ